jgi:hypothetical protein
MKFLGECPTIKLAKIIVDMKWIHYAYLRRFMNVNPCDLPMLRKLFRPTVTVRWKIIENETMDEIIYRITNIRNRLILKPSDVCNVGVKMRRIRMKSPDHFNLASHCVA